uniref:protein transport protein Sec24A n=1 Tax=Anopheles coluzzii TaxID=1518534 RepID=UPI0020FF83FE|nr:protein transport protein Sec24A [Anopheles coluzzii]XP_049463169.1 protein transport protein Sec24A [Anopheles coluzzii]
MMSYPPQYYGIPNGFPHTSNGQSPQYQYPQQQQQQQQPQQLQQPQSQDQQLYKGQSGDASNVSKGPTLPNGPPPAIANSQLPPTTAKPFTAAGAAVAGGPPAAAAAFPIPSQGSAVPTQLRTNIVQNWATTNGNSTTSSRTSSPAFGSNGMPPVAVAAPRTAPALASEPARLYPTTNGNNNHNNNNLPSMASSQLQPPPPAAPQTLPSGQATASGYNLSPNNNWSSAKMAQQPGAANLINTPPKSASGMSTPLNASTPTLTGPTILGGQQQSVQKLTASVQDLSLQRPPTMGVAAQAAGAGAATTQAPNQQSQQAPPTVNGGGPPVASTATTNGTMGAAAMFASHPAGAAGRGYGQAPPPSSAQYQQMQQQSQPPLKHTQQPQQQTAPSSMLQGPMPNGPGSTTNPSLQAAAAGMGKFNAPPPTGAALGSTMPTALSAGQTPLNKRPMYPPASAMAGAAPPPASGGQVPSQNPYTAMMQQPGAPVQTQPQHQFPSQQQQQFQQPPQQQHQQNQQQFHPQYMQQQQQQMQPQQQMHQQQQQRQQYDQSKYQAGYDDGGYGRDYSRNVVRTGFNSLWGTNAVDLLQNRHVLPTDRVTPPSIHLVNPLQSSANCNPDIFRCTLNKIPESSSLLQKSRLPLGLLIHPFRDLNNLPVISCNTIVRCKSCRTYINPFVFFSDSKKWQCNLCYRTNDLPEEFQYDPVTKTYGDPTRRPEIKSSTIEFIAPSEYMLRPPQPAIYLFLLDVSSLAQQSGYLYTVCNTLMEHLDSLPGDARTQVGFIAYNSAIHFYNISEEYNQPHEVTVLDVEDVFLPYPDNLLVNLKSCKELVKDLLKQLPKRFEHTHDTHSALGAALQVAYKLMSASGGRVTVFQTCLPNYGPGALQSRENPNNRSSKEVAHLGPATDFYKRLALECSGQQIAVDVFLLNSQYCDLATISGISKFSGGCMHHIPLYSESKPQLVKTLRKSLERYLTRKIGFEAVMRVRCTRGLTIHTFHGNFFVRSTDLLSLPNVNPDAGFGMQITYEESLTKIKTVCFQAALLYTSSKAERRIRVHTLCIPVTESLSEVMYSADPQCIVGLLSKMAVDRSVTSSLSDARDAFINATVDIISAFRLVQNLAQTSSKLMVPENLRLLPLYILAMLKHPAFRTGTSTRLDDRVFAMSEMKSLPLDQLMRYIYPDFYLLDCLFVSGNGGYVDDGHKLEPPRLHLSAEKLDSRSMFLLDCGPYMYIYIGSNVASSIVHDILGYNSVAEIPDFCIDLPSRETKASEALLNFLDIVNEEKPYTSYVQVIRDTSQFRSAMIEKFVDDRNPNSLSYYEFLQHLSTQVK